MGSPMTREKLFNPEGGESILSDEGPNTTAAFGSLLSHQSKDKFPHKVLKADAARHFYAGERMSTAHNWFGRKEIADARQKKVFLNHNFKDVIQSLFSPEFQKKHSNQGSGDYFGIVKDPETSEPAGVFYVSISNNNGSGTEQVIDARLIEAFLNTELQDAEQDLLDVDIMTGTPTSGLFKSLVGKPIDGPSKAMHLPPIGLNSGPSKSHFSFFGVPRVVLIVKIPDQATFQIFSPDNGVQINLDEGPPNTIFHDPVLAEERNFCIIGFDFRGWLLMADEGGHVHYLNIISRTIISLPSIQRVFVLERLRGDFIGEPGTDTCRTILVDEVDCGIEIMYYGDGAEGDWLIIHAPLWINGSVAALCLHVGRLFVINQADGLPYAIEWDNELVNTPGPAVLPGFEEADNDRIVSFVKRGNELLVILIRNELIQVFLMNDDDASFDPIIEVHNWVEFHQIYMVNHYKGSVFPSPPFPAQNHVTVARAGNIVECLRISDIHRVLKECSYPTVAGCRCTFAMVET